jgi:hypothetical protein
MACQTAIWLRLVKPSRRKMCWTWFCAVRSEMKSLAAICLLVSPSAHNAATSASRALSGGLASVAVAESRSPEEDPRRERRRAIRTCIGAIVSRRAIGSASSSELQANYRRGTEQLPQPGAELLETMAGDIDDASRCEVSGEIGGRHVGEVVAQLGH